MIMNLNLTWIVLMNLVLLGLVLVCKREVLRIVGGERNENENDGKKLVISG